ncbi:MAG: prealbumin-like fold domain-containing protein [Promicromonosporaceae bacterium]|nr:prealbumin-like fold domain-containing protein [Promicromonosporaceae bacterium]
MRKFVSTASRVLFAIVVGLGVAQPAQAVVPPSSVNSLNQTVNATPEAAGELSPSTAGEPGAAALEGDPHLAEIGGRWVFKSDSVTGQPLPAAEYMVFPSSAGAAAYVIHGDPQGPCLGWDAIHHDDGTVLGFVCAVRDSAYPHWAQGQNELDADYLARLAAATPMQFGVSGIGHGQTHPQPSPLLPKGITDARGALWITGLPLGEYALLEVTAPAGYEPMTVPITFNVAQFGEHDEIHVPGIRDSATPTLPVTGSAGAWYLVALGWVGFIVVVMANSKKSRPVKRRSRRWGAVPPPPQPRWACCGR